MNELQQVESFSHITAYHRMKLYSLATFKLCLLTNESKKFATNVCKKKTFRGVYTNFMQIWKIPYTFICK